MNITTFLKSLPFMAVLGLSLGLTPILSMAETGHPSQYKQQHPRTEKPKHIKHHWKHKRTSGDFKPYNDHVYNARHRNHEVEYNRHRNHDSMDRHSNRRHHDRKYRRKHQRNHHGHRHNRHNHYDRHQHRHHSGHRHDHRYCKDRRHHLNFADPRFVFGLHTGNVDIVLGH